jgi:hypothetical protein
LMLVSAGLFFPLHSMYMEKNAGYGTTNPLQEQQPHQNPVSTSCSSALDVDDFLPNTLWQSVNDSILMLVSARLISTSALNQMSWTCFIGTKGRTAARRTRVLLWLLFL